MVTVAHILGSLLAIAFLVAVFELTGMAGFIIGFLGYLFGILHVSAVEQIRRDTNG